MHAPDPSANLVTFLLYVSIATTYPTTEIMYEMDVPKKCCAAGYMFNENLECVRVESSEASHDNALYARHGVSQHPPFVSTVIASVQGLSCRDDATSGTGHDFARTYTTYHVPSRYCIDRMINGTAVLAKCPDPFSGLPLRKDGTMDVAVVTRTTITTVMTITATITMTTTANASLNDTEDNRNSTGEHSSGLGTIIFWGAQTYMNTNVAHVVLCIIVVVTYVSIPELGKSIYNRAVLRHNVCLLMLGCVLTYLGYCELRVCPMGEKFTVFVWILLQYFTNATVFWLNVICFDMTLSITRFRWMMGSGQRSNREENRRLLLYGVFAWGGALIPAVAALIFEFCPGIPGDFVLKPNYSRYRLGPNLIVNLYFFGIPLLTLFWNNVLFIFTTYKIIRIQRSTEIATRNQTNALRKKYFLFLQLYLLMGAPWFFGSLFACLNKLMILKMCRLIQPILWLLMLATHKRLRQKIASKLRFVRRKEAAAAAAADS